MTRHRWYVGNTLRLRVVIDELGVESAPGSTPTVILKRPNGTTFNATVTLETTGVYIATGLADMAGTWMYAATATVSGETVASPDYTLEVLPSQVR
jgi:nitrogen fixation protein FixH